MPKAVTARADSQEALAAAAAAASAVWPSPNAAESCALLLYVLNFGTMLGGQRRSPEFSQGLEPSQADCT